MKHLKLTFVLALVFTLKAFPQLKIDTSFSPEILVDSFLVGEGIRVGNIKVIGQKKAMGLYSADSNSIGIGQGILLSTGLSTDAVGPNETPGKSGVISLTKRGNFRGDKDLNKVAKGKTFDVLVIEFDFIPLNNKVSFRYSFGSEEYTEYVGSSFNDVFAFIIDGNEYRKKNIALLPDHKTPVTINNVNHKKNKKYFLNNDYFNNTGLFKSSSKPKISRWKKFKILVANIFNHAQTNTNGQVVFYTKAGAKNDLDKYVVENFEYDGFTKNLKVDCKVTPYKKYHLKIAIGDVGDAVFDSGVFLEKKSFHSYLDTSVSGFTMYKDKSRYFNFDSLFGKYSPPVHIPEDTTSAPEDHVDVPVVYFDPSSVAIADSAQKKLDGVAAFMKKNNNYKLEIFGFTDATGNKKDNEKLSLSRAHSVMDYLVKQGVDKNKLFYAGNSSDEPAGDNSTKEGKAMNRRVELELVAE